MTYNIKKYLLAAAAILSLNSCLDKYPTDAIPSDEAINTVEAADQAVMGIYALLKSSSLYSGDLTLLPDIQTDLVYAVEGYSNTYGDIWRWNIQSTNENVKSVYGSLNLIIGQANFLLEKLPALENTLTSDAAYNQIQQYKGEALFARALAYSDLIKLFCKAYDPATADQELGVVLVDSYSQKPVLKRASLKDSYEFVMNDLAEAAELLHVPADANVSNSYYFNEYTAYALMARNYLYMKNWDKAIEYSSKVIDSNRFSLAKASSYISSDMSMLDYMWQYDESSEIILKVGFNTTSYGGRLGQVFFNALDYSNFKPDYVPAQWVLNLYGSGDKRYDAYFGTAKTAYSHGLEWDLLAKYFGNQTFLSQYIFHVSMPKILRLAEQYLIRAEAYCRADNPQYAKASNDLTTLLRARYVSFGSMSVNKDSWFTAISEERVKELLMEGFRLQDIKRWQADGLMNGFTRKPQSCSLPMGSSLRVTKDNPCFVWPIPQHELSIPGSEVQPNESNK